VGRCALDSSVLGTSGWLCEHRNVPSDSVNDGEFPE
jgi:hypothetical protein